MGIGGTWSEMKLLSSSKSKGTCTGEEYLALDIGGSNRDNSEELVLDGIIGVAGKGGGIKGSSLTSSPRDDWAGDGGGLMAGDGGIDLTGESISNVSVVGEDPASEELEVLTGEGGTDASVVGEDPASDMFEFPIGVGNVGAVE